MIERFARRYPKEQADLIRGLIEKAKTNNWYEEYELSVNKLLFFGDEEKCFNEIQKRLICKLHKSVTCEIRNLLEERKKQKILEEIPDNLVISLQDSQDAGNSWDVTGTFWTQHFPIP